MLLISEGAARVVFRGESKEVRTEARELSENQQKSVISSIFSTIQRMLCETAVLQLTQLNKIVQAFGFIKNTY